MASFSSFNENFINHGSQGENGDNLNSSLGIDWNDLASIAALLDVGNPDDLCVQRIKVNRQKLADMIKDEERSAGEFFTTVMMETITHIYWPHQLKADARRRKDPNVRIVGQMANVLQAKDKIMERLNSWGKNVMMKMEVSYTDHPVIIGYGGSNLKRIQTETSANIHFPDSNRSNFTEKNNTVSVNGSPEAVKQAHALVRDSVPIVMSFNPILDPGRTAPNSETPYVIRIQREFNVEVKLFAGCSLVLVKGSSKEAMKVKEATLRLMFAMCGKNASQTRVEMQLDISNQFHEIVLRQKSEIANRTGTEITLSNCSENKKGSRVVIIGSIDGVYEAKQQLIGSLPVTLTFDYPENKVDYEEITRLEREYDVTISVKRKYRQNGVYFVIDGIEKFISNIYDAYSQLFKWNQPEVNVDLLDSYSESNELVNNSQSVSQMVPEPISQDSLNASMPGTASDLDSSSTDIFNRIDRQFEKENNENSDEVIRKANGILALLVF